MRVQHYDEKFPLIIIDEFYDDENLRRIWEELEFLCYPEKFENPEDTGTGVFQKELYKNIPSIFLGQIFSNLSKSSINEASRTLSDKLNQIFNQHSSWFFKDVYYAKMSVLISYYENGGYYKPHKDSSVVTCLNWFFKEPKVFEGGELYFPDYDVTVELKNHRTVIFPSFIKHGVKTVRMDKSYENKKLGRFCITQFFS